MAARIPTAGYTGGTTVARPRGPDRSPSGRSSGLRGELVVAWRLSAAVAALMAVQAGAGVAAPSIYRDTGWVTAAWYGNDLVTLLVAVPLLVGSLLAVRRGSRRAELLW